MISDKMQKALNDQINAEIFLLTYTFRWQHTLKARIGMVCSLDESAIR